MRYKLRFLWNATKGHRLAFLKWTGEMERYVHPKPKSS